MNPGDRRLLIELGIILAIKLVIIAFLKIHFFSPAPVDRQHPLAVDSGDRAARESFQPAAAVAAVDKER